MSQRARLKCGVFIAPYHPNDEDPTLCIHRDLDLVAYLDHLGFDEAWIGEHHSAGFEMISSPELFIAAAAERTRRIRLGAGVVSLPYHHPFMVANRIIQLDHQTRGKGFGVVIDHWLELPAIGRAALLLYLGAGAALALFGLDRFLLVAAARRHAGTTGPSPELPPDLMDHSPRDGARVPTLTPQFTAMGRSVDGWPTDTVRYWFELCDGEWPDWECVDSGWQDASTWQLPDGIAEWGNQYYWRVVLSDGSEIMTRTVVWGGGIQAPELVTKLGLPQGRVPSLGSPLDPERAVLFPAPGQGRQGLPRHGGADERGDLPFGRVRLGLLPAGAQLRAQPAGRDDVEHRLAEREERRRGVATVLAETEDLIAELAGADQDRMIRQFDHGACTDVGGTAAETVGKATCCEGTQHAVQIARTNRGDIAGEPVGGFLEQRIARIAAVRRRLRRRTSASTPSSSGACSVTRCTRWSPIRSRTWRCRPRSSRASSPSTRPR